MKLGFMETVLKTWEVRNQVLSVCLSRPSLLPPSSVCVGLSGHMGSPLPTISSLHVNLPCFLLNDSLFLG